MYAPIAQMTDRTAFLLESEATGAEGISTPEGWLVEVEPGQRVVPRVPEKVMEYMASGTGEELDAARYDWAWNYCGGGGAAVATADFPVSRRHSEGRGEGALGGYLWGQSVGADAGYAAAHGVHGDECGKALFRQTLRT